MNREYSELIANNLEIGRVDSGAVDAVEGGVSAALVAVGERVAGGAAWAGVPVMIINH